MISSTNDEAIDDCKSKFQKCLLNIKPILPPITNHNASDNEKRLFISNIHKLLKQNEINTNIVPNSTTRQLPNIEAKDISTKSITRSNKKEPNISDEVINQINFLINQFNQNYYPNSSGGKPKSKSKTKKKKKNYKKKTKTRSKTRRKNKRKRNKRRKTYKKKK
jgi:hypothetical protein